MNSTDYAAELSKCVRCGSCKAYCPTYDEGLTEAMGARGRLTLLRKLSAGQISPSPLFEDRIFSCILCGACENLCPPGVDITGAMYHGRRIIGHLDRRRRYLGHLMRFSTRRPMLSFGIAKALQNAGFPPARIFNLMERFFGEKGWINKISGRRKGIMPFNITLPHSPLKDDRQVYRPERKIGRVALFTGCSVNFIFPHIGLSLINILLRLGYEVVLPSGEVCCGAPFRSLGLEEDAAESAKKNYEIFSRLNAEAILSLCPTCIVSIKNHYPKLIGKGFDNAMDISSFLIDKMESLSMSAVHGLTKVTYHDPCHLNYSLGVKREPRELILRTGAELIESEREGCCGFGGVFSLHYGDISKNLAEKSAGTYLKTEAEAVITSCPGCMMQLGSVMKGKPVFHIIELLEEATCK